MKNNKSAYIRLDLIMLAITFGLHGLIAFALSPLYSILASDVTVPVIFPDLIRWGIDIIDISIMSCGFCLTSAIFFMNYGKKWIYPAIYMGAALFRRLAALLMTLVVNGAIATDEIMMSISVFVLDGFMLLAILLVSSVFSKKYLRLITETQKASALFNDEKIDRSDISSIYPFKKLISFDNPLQCCLFTTAVIMSAVKLVGRTLALIIESTPSVLMTLGGYASDLLILVISYALSCWLLSFLYKTDAKRRALDSLYK